MRVRPARHATRWLVLAGLAIMIPLCLAVTGIASAKQSTAQDRPVIDTAYLYGQLYDISTNYVYRISGADGPPADPSSAFNIPATINGWQEFFAHWKSQLTDTGVMGSEASFATATNHYFRRTGGYQFDSNDAEVTIPGATCAGQRVLITSHPDEVPVPPTVATLIPTNSTANFGIARRQITLSNLGNGGAYDASSGLALTLAEYQALLRWYAANGTWPKRTLKVTLLDARQGRPLTPVNEGANFYVNNLIPKGPQGKVVLFANMDMNGLEYPAYHWGTGFFAKDTTNGTTGPWFTNILATPVAANPVYPSASPGWTKIQNNLPAVQSFRTALTASVTDAFAVLGAKYNFSVPNENPLRYNRFGGSPSVAPTPVVKPAYSEADRIAKSPVRDDTLGRFDQVPFNNQGIPGFNVFGAYDSTPDDNPYPNNGNVPRVLQYAGYGTTFQIGNGTPTVGSTTTSAATAVGTTNVKVASVASFTVGDQIFIDSGASVEYRQIQTVGTAGAAGTGITLTAPLQLAHASGVPFQVNEGTPLGFTGDTLDHLNYWASGLVHGLGGVTDPSVELLRALELPSTWTTYLLQRDEYAGAVPQASSPIAYFETDPVNPTGTTVTFNASFSRKNDGGTGGLSYVWDFGDGTTATTDSPTISHTFSGPVNADVKLAVLDGGNAGFYRQALAVGGTSDPAPATDACGTLTGAEQSSLLAAAGH